MRKRLVQSGFTLIEIIVVVSIVGLLTLLVTFGAGNNIKVERLGGEVKQFADDLRQAQTHSVTTQSANSCSSSFQAPGGQSANTCYWRGTVMDYIVSSAPQQPYTMSVLSGQDLSAYSGNLDPQIGITGKTLSSTYNTGTMGICNVLAGGIGVLTPDSSLCSGNAMDYTSVGSSGSTYSLAFLAPNGQAFGCTTPAVASCDPQTNPTPFTLNTGKVAFILRDAASSLIGIVTFDLASGTISTTVQ